MRFDFEKIGPSKIYLDTSNEEYLVLCDVLGNGYKVKKEEILDVEYKPESKNVSIMGIPINKFKSVLNIRFSFKAKNGCVEERIAAYTSIDKEYIEHAFNEVEKWRGYLCN